MTTRKPAMPGSPPSGSTDFESKQTSRAGVARNGTEILTMKEKKKKVAVVLIHGVGEQVPMDTLRGFVEAVWTNNPAVGREGGVNRIWSKPDTMSGDLELRRLTTSANRDRKYVHFYEFYWAHMMNGTEVSHLLAWLWVLINRQPGAVPKQLRGVWYFLVTSAIAVALGFAAFWIWGDAVPAWLKIGAGAVGSVIWATIGAFAVKKVAGDAARYLHVAPENIES
ncbi:MAG: hypothetical protein JWR69_4620, partial [Pedosphaera sp.]|nr:hypothetical protein [Pedosphaera sp.]